MTYVIIATLIIYIVYISRQFNKLNEFIGFYVILLVTTMTEKEMKKAVLALFTYTASCGESTIDHGSFWKNVCSKLGVHFNESNYGLDLHNVERIHKQLVMRQKLVKASDENIWKYQKSTIEQLLSEFNSSNEE